MVRAIMRCIDQRFDVVRAVHNGQDAVQAVIELKPQVVVLDIHMPVLDGIKAARVLHAMNVDSKIVMLTAMEELEIVEACREAGAHAFVIKRRMLQDLLGAMNAVLGGSSFGLPTQASLSTAQPGEVTGQQQTCLKLDLRTARRSEQSA
jgi:DNA-binding NarL/FixJ family response regulator